MGSSRCPCPQDDEGMPLRWFGCQWDRKDANDTVGMQKGQFKCPLGACDDCSQRRW